jgi:diguanylate cyclase (GGDEF)-like protein
MDFIRSQRIANPEPPPALLAGLVAVVGAIGYVDYLSGPDIGFSLFYLVPVIAAGWWLGKSGAACIAAVAACSWFVADYLIRVDPLISIWNGTTRLIIFALQGWLIAVLREDRRRQALLARTDPTTGLPNSRAFLEALTNAPRQDGNVCIMFIDLDHFKEVNDRYGHAAGDDVLEKFAARLRTAIGPADVAARMGGDEFAILLRDVTETDAKGVGQRIIEMTRSVAHEYPGTEFGASVGIALGDPAQAEHLLDEADRVMYEAKRRGQGSVSMVVTSGGDSRHVPAGGRDPRIMA